MRKLAITALFFTDADAAISDGLISADLAGWPTRPDYAVIMSEETEAELKGKTVAAIDRAARALAREIAAAAEELEAADRAN